MDDSELELNFLAALYDVLMGIADGGLLVSGPQESPHPEWNTADHPALSPRQWGWQWTIHGTRDRWWIEVMDERPPMRGRPYYVDPRGDKEFFGMAYTAHLVARDQMTHYVSMLLTHMDEKLVGQAEANRAYAQGATVDSPPWIQTDSKG